MKKLLLLALTLTVLLTAALTGCGKTVSLTATDVTDLPQEDFAIAVKKGDTEILNAVNAVVDDWVANGKIDAYTEYYTDLEAGKNPTAPEGLTVEWTFTGTETFTMFTESGFAPYEFPYMGGIAGVDVAIMSQVAVNLGLKLEIKNENFNMLITDLNSHSGKGAVAAGLSITEERKASVDFSNPYSSSTLTVVSSKEKTYSTLESLDGLKIGVQQGTSGDIIATAAASAKGYTVAATDTSPEKNIKIDATVKHYETYTAALADLKAGRIDVIFMDKLPAMLLVSKA